MATMKLQDFYKRNHWREPGMFDQVEHSYGLLSRVILTVLVTPFAIGSILLQDYLLMVANIFLALWNIRSLVKSTKTRQIVGAELIANWMLFAAAVAIGVFFASTIVMTPMSVIGITSVIFCANIIAISVNMTALVKNIIVPPLSKVILSIGSMFGLRSFLSTDDTYDYLLHPKKDQVAINNIPLSKSFEEKKKFADNIIRVIAKYKNKYNNRVFGSVRFESDINNFENMLSDITTSGRILTAKNFITTKGKNKYYKIQVLLQRKSKLEQAYFKVIKQSENANTAYLTLLSKTTTMSKPMIKASLNEKHTLTLGLIDAEINRQQIKFEWLSKGLTKDVVTEIKSNTTLQASA